MGIGAEAVEQLLSEIDLDEESLELKEEIANTRGQQSRAIRRLEVVEGFRLVGNDPTWLILDVLPVIHQNCALWCSWMGSALRLLV